MKHLRGLDGLRAIAVLAVVAYHAGLPVPAGFVGVDIFFVISGFLITKLLHDELQQNGRIDFIGFYARRARRILPAVVLTVIVTLLLSAITLKTGLGEVAKSAAAASAFVANLFFLRHSGGYWDADAATMPLLHLWSLSVEEQFYMLWPLLMLRVRTVRGLAVTALASFALAEILLVLEPQAAFYQMPARAWELAVGGMIALYPLRLPRGSGWAGLTITLAACFVPLPHFPGIGALPAVLGAALLIAAVQAGERVSVLEWRPVVFVGLISYSLYLWHWPLLALHHAVQIGPSPLKVRLGLCAIAFVLAWLSYRYIEMPFRRASVGNRKTIAVGAVAAVLLSGASFAVAMRDPGISRGAVDYQAEKAGNDHPDVLICHYLENSPFDQLPKSGCNPTGAKVVIWGDSYALAWKPLAWSLAAHQGMLPSEVSRDHCPPTLGRLELKSEQETSLCAGFNTAVIAYIRRTQPDTVILAARWTDVLPKSEPQVLAAVAAIRPYARRILIVGPSPEMPDTMPRCLSIGVECKITRAEFDAESAGPNRFLSSIPGTSVIRVTDYFCTPESCKGTKNGVALYWDDHHVSSTAARNFAENWLNPSP
jgi:peptidoglycan/LPS O-acetylase OafA/YrhL